MATIDWEALDRDKYSDENKLVENYQQLGSGLIKANI